MTYTVREAGEVDVRRCGVNSKRNAVGKVEVSDSGWWTWLGDLSYSRI